MTQITNRIIKTQIKINNELKPVCLGKFEFGSKRKIGNCYHCLWSDECIKMVRVGDYYG